VLSGHLGRLAETLTRLEAHVSIEREGRAAWSDAVEACLAMTPAVKGIVRAMEFREPAAEKLRDAVESAEALRARFAEVLALVNAQPSQNAQLPQ
jgi:hypothetical protein